MNPSNTWKGKLEAASFFHLKTYKGSVGFLNKLLWLFRSQQFSYTQNKGGLDTYPSHLSQNQNVFNIGRVAIIRGILFIDSNDKCHFKETDVSQPKHHEVA